MDWYTSDEHHGHRNIIQFCKRPFASIEEMTEGLIERHNEVVKTDDRVWHLGDMFWRTFGVFAALDVMKRLNGSHFYVNGNHEEVFHVGGNLGSTLHLAFNDRFERTQIFPAGGPKHGIILDHYAGRVWHDSDKGSWQLYGHTHSALPEIDPLLALDVGVDANNYYPVSLDQVRERMESKLKRIQRNMGVSTTLPTYRG